MFHGSENGGGQAWHGAGLSREGCERTSRRRSSSPRPPSCPRWWATRTCRRCRCRRARRGCCRTGGPSRRRQRSAGPRRGCCGSTRRPGSPWRPLWLFGVDEVSFLRPGTVFKMLPSPDHLPEQLGDVGHLPLVLDVAGSSVARTMAGAARREKKLVKCILADVGVCLLSRSW